MVSVLLTVIFTILKIIGISLLAILGLVLFILLLVLFVPVRYHAKGKYLNKGEFGTDIHAAWLLHIVSFKAGFNGGQAFHTRLKLFGITIYDNLRGKKIRNKKSKTTKTKTKGAGEIQAASLDEAKEDDIPHTNDTGNEGVKLENDYDKETKVTDYIGNDRKKEIKTNIFQKIKGIFTKIANFFKNLKFTFQKICDTIVRIKDNIKYYLEIWQLDSTQQALSVCKRQLVRIFGKIKPKKFRVDLHLGFEDPAVMGEVLAVWGMFYPVHQGNIDICPEFGTPVFEGSFYIKGSIGLCTFAKAALTLFFDKNIRVLIKRLKQKTV